MAMHRTLDPGQIDYFVYGITTKIAPAMPRLSKKAQIISDDVPAASQYSERSKRRILVDGILREV